jgi:uncharacterized protein (DUF1778 family)
VANKAKNDARLGFRLNSQAKELIERAALLNGQSLSDFATSTLLEKARQIVQAEATRTLTERDAMTFLVMLDDDRPNKSLRKAAGRYKARARHG